MLLRLPLQGNVVKDVPDAVAQNLLKQGQAERVDEEGNPMEKRKKKAKAGAPENKARL